MVVISFKTAWDRQEETGLNWLVKRRKPEDWPQRPSAAKPQRKKGVRSQEIARTRRSQETIFGENPKYRKLIPPVPCIDVFFLRLLCFFAEKNSVVRMLEP